jgi:hypothetical protein
MGRDMNPGRPLYPRGKSPWYPMNRRAGRATEPVWAFRRKTLSSPEIQIPDRPAPRLAYKTSFVRRQKFTGTQDLPVYLVICVS